MFVSSGNHPTSQHPHYYILFAIMPGVGPNMSASQSELLAISITEDLVPSTASKCPSVTSIDFDGLLNPPLLLQDDPTECGGQLWPGGMVLATYLLQTKMTELQGRTMLVPCLLQGPILRVTLGC